MKKTKKVIIIVLSILLAIILIYSSFGLVAGFIAMLVVNKSTVKFRKAFCPASPAFSAEPPARYGWRPLQEWG